MNTVVCSGCGETVEAETVNTGYPDKGWVLPFETFGYYGGFSDDLDTFGSDSEPVLWLLCHDCIVRFLSAFPLLAKTKSKGGHPCEAVTPCCDFAWKPDGSGGYLVAEFGEWVKPT